MTKSPDDVLLIFPIVKQSVAVLGRTVEQRERERNITQLWRKMGEEDQGRPGSDRRQALGGSGKEAEGEV